MDEPSPTERNETPAERLDRNWAELLAELRVSQPGVQVLAGFLLTLPFQARFSELPPWLVDVYLVASVLGVLAAGFMVAPVSVHRGLFRQGAKADLVNAADLLTKLGLVWLGLTMVLVLVIVFGMVAGQLAAILAGIIAAAGFAVLWLLVPLGLGLRHRRRQSDRRAATRRD